MRGRGYLSNRSMSVNAAIAYENGERPISKWRKDDILNGLGRELVAALNLDRYPAAFLKEMYLQPVAWHHTSRHYNVTDFYALRQTGSITQEQALLASRYPEWAEEQARMKAVKAVREEPVKALVRYLVWPKTGGRKKKRPLVREEYAILLPPFAYLASGTRKSWTVLISRWSSGLRLCLVVRVRFLRSSSLASQESDTHHAIVRLFVYSMCYCCLVQNRSAHTGAYNRKGRHRQMPATITRAWTHVKNFIERHALAFLTPFLVLSFLMYKAEAGYPADGYSGFVTVFFFFMVCLYSGAIADRLGFFPEEEEEKEEEPASDKPVEKITTRGHYTWRA